MGLFTIVLLVVIGCYMIHKIISGGAQLLLWTLIGIIVTLVYFGMRFIIENPITTGAIITGVVLLYLGNRWEKQKIDEQSSLEDDPTAPSGKSEIIYLDDEIK